MPWAREFTSQDGRKINGELLAHSGDQVIIKVGAKEFAAPVANFSLDDGRRGSSSAISSTSKRSAKMSPRARHRVR
jgi:hypothetical protein